MGLRGPWVSLSLNKIREKVEEKRVSTPTHAKRTDEAIDWRRLRLFFVSFGSAYAVRFWKKKSPSRHRSVLNKKTKKRDNPHPHIHKHTHTYTHTHTHNKPENKKTKEEKKCPIQSQPSSPAQRPTSPRHLPPTPSALHHPHTQTISQKRPPTHPSSPKSTLPLTAKTATKTVAAAVSNTPGRSALKKKTNYTDKSMDGGHIFLLRRGGPIGLRILLMRRGVWWRPLASLGRRGLLVGYVKFFVVGKKRKYICFINLIWWSDCSLNYRHRLPSCPLKNHYLYIHN